MRHVRVAVAVAVSCVALAACGSSSSSSSAPVASGGASTAGGSKSPVVIYGIAPEDAAGATSQPGLQEALRAGVDYFNARGGLNGHRLDFKFCNNLEDPNKTTQCAQNAVSDKAAAVVGIYSHIPQYHDILNRAGIPVLDAAAIDAQALTSPGTYIISAGGTGQSFGLAHGAAELGYKNVTVVASQIPATKPIAAAFVDAAKAQNVKVGKTVTVPPTLTDLSSIAAQIGSPDAVFLLLPPPQVLAYMAAAKQANLKEPLLANAGLLQESQITQTGGSASPANGALVASLYPTGDNPAWAEFKSAVNAYSGAKADIDYNNLAVQGAWVGLKIFMAVGQKVNGDITAASFTAQLKKMTNLEITGLTPTMDFSTPFKSSKFPRQFNREIYFSTVKDGKFVEYPGLKPADVTSDFLR
jgi:ABC-type branched-subunit amino acid transport system substrate-binding protein